MDDLSPEQQKKLEAMVDARIKQHEYQQRNKTMGVKGWSGAGVIILNIVLQMFGAPPELSILLFLIALLLFYSESKDKLQKSES